MIPHNIASQHILLAINELKENGIPDFRKSRKYHLQFEGNLYPPKLLISIANKFANNHELDSGTFGGGAETNSFLELLGFEIIKLSSLKEQEKQTDKLRKKLRHTERCKDCKKKIVLLLTHLFGEVIENHQINIGPRLEDFSSHPEYAALEKIFKALGEFRGNKNFIMTNKLPRVDYFIKSQNCIVEFDESQHFTQCRKITLENYPDNMNVGFNKEKWKALCDQYNSTDNLPVYRDEQRAWYDTLRDFVPNIFGLKPTIRLHALDEKWCELNPYIGVDMKKFKNHLVISGDELRKEIGVTVYKSSAPKIARIVLSSDWISNLDEAKEVLNTICVNWPQGQKVDFLITPGAFLGFDLPHELLRDLDNKEPPMFVQARLFNLAEDVCMKLLDGELIKKLSNYTRYISLGVDSFKIKVSLSYIKIKKPHAELVGLYDLKEGIFYWTGKSFPTVGQQKGLIRISDLNSHFMQTEFGKVMVLGCHDLSIYSPRGKATTKDIWRKNIRSEFKKKAIEEKPEIVLHHPHNSDSSRTWTASWNELKRDLPSICLYAGAGKYFRSEGKQRSRIEKVLQKNKLGSILNFIVKNYYKV
jgi:hypothetical protein